MSNWDSKAYNAVLDMNVYPTGFAVVKEECVNHVHKTMGKALLTLTKKMHFGGTGFGRLTQGKTLQFQNYYRGAVMTFIIAVAPMRIHNIINALQEVKSWCFYQQAIADEKERPSHATF